VTDPTDVSLDVATAADHTLLSNLLELYIHDLSRAFPNVEMGPDGRFGYRRLPLYWSEPARRFAFLIKCGGRVAGFVLVTRGSPDSPETEDENALDVAEFFVMRRYRRSGVGRRAAFLVWTVVVAIDKNDKNVFPVVIPAVVGIAALVLAAALAYAGSNGRAFAMTALGTVATVVTLFTGLYPRVMVSSTDFSDSLDVPGAASAHYTLVVLTVVALITLPVVLLYQGWSYYVFRARVRGEDVDLPAVASPTGGSPAG